MNIDLLDPDRFQRGEHHEMFKVLRNTDPGIHWHDEPDGTGFWSVTRIDHLREVNRNTDVFSSNAGGTQIADPPPGDLEAQSTVTTSCSTWIRPSTRATASSSTAASRRG